MVPKLEWTGASHCRSSWRRAARAAYGPSRVARLSLQILTVHFRPLTATLAAAGKGGGAGGLQWTAGRWMWQRSVGFCTSVGSASGWSLVGFPKRVQRPKANSDEERCCDGWRCCCFVFVSAVFVFTAPRAARRASEDEVTAIQAAMQDLEPSEREPLGT